MVRRRRRSKGMFRRGEFVCVCVCVCFGVGVDVVLESRVGIVEAMVCVYVMLWSELWGSYALGVIMRW